MYIIKRLIRIYTPFIRSLVSLIYGVLLYLEISFENMDFIMSTLTGNSILICLYMLSCSEKMCIWYKINIATLIMVHITSLIYFITPMTEALYLYAVVILSIIGVISFLIYRVTVGITKFLC